MHSLKKHKAKAILSVALITFIAKWSSKRSASYSVVITVEKKATIHQVTTMLATSKNVLFPGHNYLLTTDTDDPTL